MVSFMSNSLFLLIICAGYASIIGYSAFLLSVFLHKHVQSLYLPAKNLCTDIQTTSCLLPFMKAKGSDNVSLALAEVDKVRPELIKYMTHQNPPLCVYCVVPSRSLHLQ